MQKVVGIAVAAIAVALIAGAILIEVPAVNAATVECSWGQIKCCYGDPPCTNQCCPRPKDEEVEMVGDDGYALNMILKPVWMRFGVVAAG